MTPHINASLNDIAEIVLMPGDPLRAKYIAENYLEDARLVSDVRNMFAFTGFYKGVRISVMGHGMGIPSVSIYAHELIHEYGAKKLIRVGSCGGVAEDINLRDIIVVNAASTGSGTNRARFAGYDYASVPDFEMLKNCWQTADELQTKVRVGGIFTNDFFYGDPDNLLPALQKMNILAMDMESAALFAIAAESRVQALSIITVSDHVVKGGEMSVLERQTTFDQMMVLALETAIRD
ncbi:purine nucleoside phosphorylase [Shewanella sediminis HAW-EB3]|uniref:Purine nucleoside phosphorylase DeoD-type n=1 Tax=Shewanella sediminis (strain HAW-EB3) TaxID=425104 RepID=A8FUL3_SHESH|nr:purine-nucleoside phosphorylase [Shewanella sediminis]ABV36536.1 purine nucleoside phosphorylase [Shewanella sediminis HAW-EB3]